MSKAPTKVQVSAGGVAYRERGKRIEVAIISVGEPVRWQLPKGIVARSEQPEEAALREVREETGIRAELIELIDKIEYWYFSGKGADRVRFHKFVYFYLMRYVSGDVTDHDDEVNEARWVKIDEAIDMLAFPTEKKVVERAREMIADATESRS